MLATEGTAPLLISHGFCLNIVLPKRRVCPTPLHRRKPWTEHGDSVYHYSDGGPAKMEKTAEDGENCCCDTLSPQPNIHPERQFMI